MNLTQIKAFHVVARAGSFSLAARSQGVSQPTLSAQVKALESNYGVALFDRLGRGVQLTPTGQSLYLVTTRLFAAEEEAGALLAGSGALTRGFLRVSADGPYHVMPILAELKRLHAGITFTVKIDNSATVLEHVLNHAADVAVTAKVTSDPRIHSMKLREDKLVLFVPRDHPWSRRRRVRLADLAGRDIVVRERGSITREAFETRLVEAGVVPGSLIEVQTREAVREAVSAGFGVGVVFDSEFRADSRCNPVGIGDCDLSVGEYVVCLQENRQLALVRAFLEAATRAGGRSSALDPLPAAATRNGSSTKLLSEASLAD
jgi:aminoethylphosphonate catabolism LysR family transcriptional regulator